MGDSGSYKMQLNLEPTDCGGDTDKVSQTRSDKLTTFGCETETSKFS